MSYKLLKSLLLKAAQIQNRIDMEQKSKYHDWVTLVRLKKIRLKISERIHAISRQYFKGNTSRLSLGVVKHNRITN